MGLTSTAWVVNHKLTKLGRAFQCHRDPHEFNEHDTYVFRQTTSRRQHGELVQTRSNWIPPMFPPHTKQGFYQTNGANSGFEARTHEQQNKDPQPQFRPEVGGSSGHARGMGQQEQQNNMGFGGDEGFYDRGYALTREREREREGFAVQNNTNADTRDTFGFPFDTNVGSGHGRATHDRYVSPYERRGRARGVPSTNFASKTHCDNHWSDLDHARQRFRDLRSLRGGNGVQCFGCGKTGHMRRDCLNAKKHADIVQQMWDEEDVNGTAVVHCGFYSEKGGFKLSEEDKSYMQTCKVVVSTCTFGGGDDLYQPIGMSQASLEKVCYVAFWDEITLATQEADGKKINVDRMIGKWHIVIVRDLPFTDQRLNGKIPKMLTHRLFPQARFSIWVDSKSQFRRDPLGVLEALLWRTNSILAISEHGARSSVYDEAKAVVHKNKAAPEEVDRQMTQYLHDGFPDDKRFYGKKALAEASIIVKEHTPLTNLFMCLWFNEVVRFTSRDQLSFPYVHRRLRLKRINMFHVCTRKDLVNSIGHKRKAKPLIS
ncbi:hypothetical protein GIB67_007430 [Kingdonia uniflora]|uniref:CCHC-type domain-containing protein n=1 Tax=Kingdonia uniflora TaxID=39325 RepID=A0A7J7MLL2_9MAGN|nr:hypothetical protein GIB67_007430 [Kingdonia uniflora]